MAHLTRSDIMSLIVKTDHDDPYCHFRDFEFICGVFAAVQDSGHAIARQEWSEAEQRMVPTEPLQLDPDLAEAASDLYEQDPSQLSYDDGRTIYDYSGWQGAGRYGLACHDLWEHCSDYASYLSLEAKVLLAVLQYRQSHLRYRSCIWPAGLFKAMNPGFVRFVSDWMSLDDAFAELHSRLNELRGTDEEFWLSVHKVYDDGPAMGWVPESVPESVGRQVFRTELQQPDLRADPSAYTGLRKLRKYEDGTSTLEADIYWLENGSTSYACSLWSPVPEDWDRSGREPFALMEEALCWSHGFEYDEAKFHEEDFELDEDALER